MLRRDESIVQFALLWGSTFSASLATRRARVSLAGAGAGRVDIRRRSGDRRACGTRRPQYFVPASGDVRKPAAESLFYVCCLQPGLCAVFVQHTSGDPVDGDDFGANLLGAIVGGVGEYLSLLAGYQFLLVLVAACYLAAIATAPRIAERGLRIAP